MSREPTVETCKGAWGRRAVAPVVRVPCPTRVGLIAAIALCLPTAFSHAEGTYVPRSPELREQRVVHGPAAVASSVRFCGPDDKLAVGFFNNQVAVYAPSSSEPVTLAGHENWVTALAWSSHQELLASAGLDQKVLLWRSSDNKPTPLPGHDRWIRALAMSADGRLLASGGDDGLVKLWDLPATANTPVQTASQSSAAAPGLRLTLVGHTDWVMSLAFSPRGDWLASGALDGTIRLWRTGDGAAAHVLRLPPPAASSAVLTLAADPYGKLLASSGADAAVRLWDTASGQCIATLPGHRDQVFAVAFHPCGRLLASAGADGTVRLWDAVTRQELQVLADHHQWVYALDFSADGRRLASAGADEAVRVWTWRELVPSDVGTQTRERGGVHPEK